MKNFLVGIAAGFLFLIGCGKLDGLDDIAAAKATELAVQDVAQQQRPHSPRERVIRRVCSNLYGDHALVQRNAQGIWECFRTIKS